MKASIIRNSKTMLYKLSILMFWVLIWQMVYIKIGRDIYVPSPLNVLLRLKELLVLTSFWASVAHSMLRVAAGLLISMVVGGLLGILCSLNRLLHDLLQPMIIAIKSTPVVSFILVAIVWFPSSRIPVFICFLMCFPVIWTNVVSGFNSVDKKLLEMAQVYRVSLFNITKHIYLPSIKPYFFAACITCLGVGWKVSVAAEVLSHPRYGIGTQLYSSKVYLDSTDLFAWTLVIILLSIAFELLFVKMIELNSNTKVKGYSAAKGEKENGNRSTADI